MTNPAAPSASEAVRSHSTADSNERNVAVVWEAAIHLWGALDEAWTFRRSRERAPASRRQ